MSNSLYRKKGRVRTLYFLRSLTDEVDAKVLSRFGVERRHKAWQPPSKVLQELPNITRYYVQLPEQKTALNNIKYSKESAYNVQAFSTSSNKRLIVQIDKAQATQDSTIPVLL